MTYIIFENKVNDPYVEQFKPNLTPRQIFKMGSFGGTYWRPIKSQITGKSHKNRHLKFKSLGWWDGIDDNLLTRPFDEYDKSLNKYKVKCGTTLEFWEDKNWINKNDPYGWVEWYCNFYNGRRIPDEDERQIKRWLNFCGPKGRFKRALINKIKNKKTTFDDYNVSPVIRQSLQHWGCILTKEDLE